jgi:NADPH-dependent glutamate synthase beta subunit-like oxidoreductase
MTDPTPSASLTRPTHVVAVVGGATAGAEVAGRLAQRGVVVVVFEQNPRPFGKIEDGLPRWHRELRHKEYETIGGKLGQPGVHFVPLTKIGRDLAFEDVARAWGFSAVVLANGAWRDRPLAIDGADRFVDRGLVYQNPFIIWFNHLGDAGYTGPTFAALDGSIVVGGGLASIDVAKVLMLENVLAKLRERGIEQDLVELEVKGIPKALEKHGLRYEELGLAGSTIYYRRRVEDMPLMEAPEGADAARLAKVEQGRRRMLDKAIEKYRFAIEPLCMPDGLLVEGDRLVGLRFRRTRMENGRPVPTDETFERRGAQVLSSIGSIPEPIPGIPTKGELFAFSDWSWGRLPGYPNLFSVGNVVTGKGNIVASRKHATAVSREAIERFLGVGDMEGHAGEGALLEGAVANARAAADGIHAEISAHAPPPAEQGNAILARVRERQRAVGYGGDYAAWLARVRPVG